VERVTVQAAPAPTRDGAEAADSADSSLLNLIDRLSALLDRTELTELEVQVGSTGLILRKPSAIAPAGPVAVQVAAAPGSGEGPGGASAPAAGPPQRPAVSATRAASGTAPRRPARRRT
jgi:hypothetical protein